MRLQGRAGGANLASSSHRTISGMQPLLTRLVPVLLLLAISFAQCLFASSATAAACKCGTNKITDLAKQAEVVFVGTIQDRAAKGPEVTYTVKVARIFKGQVPGTEVRVVTAAESAACGLGTLPESSKMMVFAKAGAPLRTTSCAGSGKATTELIGKVENVLGEGKVPQAPPSDGTDPSPPPAANRTQLPSTAAPPLSRLLVPAGVLALAGLGGLAASAWLARRP